MPCWCPHRNVILKSTSIEPLENPDVRSAYGKNKPLCLIMGASISHRVVRENMSYARMIEGRSSDRIIANLGGYHG